MYNIYCTLFVVGTLIYQGNYSTFFFFGSIIGTTACITSPQHLIRSASQLHRLFKKRKKNITKPYNTLSLNTQ